MITTPAAANTDLIGAITFAGTGVAGATVTLFDNGVQVGQQVAAANGSWDWNCNGTVEPEIQAETDAARLQNGELVYAGFTRGAPQAYAQPYAEFPI